MYSNYLLLYFREMQNKLFFGSELSHRLLGSHIFVSVLCAFAPSPANFLLLLICIFVWSRNDAPKRSRTSCFFLAAMSTKRKCQSKRENPMETNRERKEGNIFQSGLFELMLPQGFTQQYYPYGKSFFTASTSILVIVRSYRYLWWCRPGPIFFFTGKSSWWKFISSLTWRPYREPGFIFPH